jgi:hypothetical protein
MGYNVDDVLKNVVVYYTRKKNVKNEWLVMIWNLYHFKRCNIKSIKSSYFQKIIFIKKYFKKSCIGTTINIYHNNVQKKLFKNSFIWKSYFWVKRHDSLLKITLLVHCILFGVLCAFAFLMDQGFYHWCIWDSCK